MHELSIARSLVRLVLENAPSGAAVRSVRVRVGPMQAIAPDAMQLAWRAATRDTELRNSELQLTLVPWELRCRACERWWFSQSWDDPCTCGSCDVTPTGGGELILVSIDVADGIVGQAPAPAGQHHTARN